MNKKVRIIAMAAVAVLVVGVALFLYEDTIFGSSEDSNNVDSNIKSIQTPPTTNTPQVATSSACSSNNANICLESAKKLIDSKDLVKALGLLIQGCEYKNAESCLLLANLYNDENAIPKSQYLYFGYLTKACLLDSTEGCYDLGVKYYRGDKLTKRDIKKSFELFEKVCSSGDMKGCNNLGVIYNNGASGIKKDLKLAKDLFTKACESGYKPSCDNINKVFK